MDPKTFLHTVIAVEQSCRLYQIQIPRQLEDIFDEDKPSLGDLGLDLEKLKEGTKEVLLDAFPRTHFRAILRRSLEASNGV